jgi:hypothetical protein
MTKCRCWSIRRPWLLSIAPSCKWFSKRHGYQFDVYISQDFVSEMQVNFFFFLLCSSFFRSKKNRGNWCCCSFDFSTGSAVGSISVLLQNVIHSCAQGRSRECFATMEGERVRGHRVCCIIVCAKKKEKDNFPQQTLVVVSFCFLLLISILGWFIT